MNSLLLSRRFWTRALTIREHQPNCHSEDERLYRDDEESAVRFYIPQVFSPFPKRICGTASRLSRAHPCGIM